MDALALRLKKAIDLGVNSDFIVVGAGAAGCVMAERLSREPDRSVTLIEAGGPPRASEHKIPAAFSKLFKTDVDWAFYTEPQAHLAQRRLYWPRGKVLGGSTQINAMIYQRGHRAVYDEWQRLGCEGWGYDALLPHFKSLVAHQWRRDDFHGGRGKLRVSKLRAPSGLSRAFIEAAVEAGLGRCEDFNGATQLGVGLYEVTQHHGQRHGAFEAFLQPALSRTNLTVLDHARAVRLCFEGRRCVGVEYKRDGKLARASASEVILCSGAIQSPQLLMASGIGPADHLRSLGVKVLQDLPGVGENLQDHPLVALCYRCKQPVSLAAAESLPSLIKYLVFKTGMLTSNVGEAGGFVQLDHDELAPDLQYHFAPGYYLEHGFVQPAGHGFSIGPTLVMPKSRGRITLRSGNVFVPPLIDPNYLADPSDRVRLVEGLKLGRQIAERSALRYYKGEEYLPGAQMSTDQALSDYVQRNLETLYHPAGTCAMGEGPQAVVDPRLRVWGIEGLRVADASVMPLLVNANTMVPTMVIAAKGAQVLLDGVSPQRAR